MFLGVGFEILNTPAISSFFLGFKMWTMFFFILPVIVMSSTVLESYATVLKEKLEASFCKLSSS